MRQEKKKLPTHKFLPEVDKSNGWKWFSKDIGNLIKSRDRENLDEARSDVRTEVMVLQTNMAV